MVSPRARVVLAMGLFLCPGISAQEEESQHPSRIWLGDLVGIPERHRELMAWAEECWLALASEPGSLDSIDEDALAQQRSRLGSELPGRGDSVLGWQDRTRLIRGASAGGVPSTSLARPGLTPAAAAPHGQPPAVAPALPRARVLGGEVQPRAEPSWPRLRYEAPQWHRWYPTPVLLPGQVLSSDRADSGGRADARWVGLGTAGTRRDYNSVAVLQPSGHVIQQYPGSPFDFRLAPDYTIYAPTLGLGARALDLAPYPAALLGSRSSWQATPLPTLTTSSSLDAAAPAWTGTHHSEQRLRAPGLSVVTIGPELLDEITPGSSLLLPPGDSLLFLVDRSGRPLVAIPARTP